MEPSQDTSWSIRYRYVILSFWTHCSSLPFLSLLCRHCKSIKLAGKATCVKFGPDAKYVAVGSMDRNLRIFGLPSDDSTEDSAQDSWIEDASQVSPSRVARAYLINLYFVWRILVLISIEIQHRRNWQLQTRRNERWKRDLVEHISDHSRPWVDLKQHPKGIPAPTEDPLALMIHRTRAWD